MLEEYLYAKGYVFYNHKSDENDDSETGIVHEMDVLEEDETEWLREHNDMDWRN